jgi:hypothetical protein
LKGSSRQPTKLTLTHHASGANCNRMWKRQSATFDMRKAGAREFFRRLKTRSEFTRSKRPGARLAT